MDKLLIIGLISIGGLMGTVIQLTRKYLVNKMDIYSIIVIDLFITGFFLLCIALYFGNYTEIKKNIVNMDLQTLGIFLLSAFGITISNIIGYQLLQKHQLGYLVVLDNGIELVTTIIIASILLGEKLTYNKLLAIPILLLGMYIYI